MPLSCSDQKQILLYRLFEWASRPRSSLALLGIANSIDLTDRFLPRLRQKLRELADVNRDESAQSCLPEPELLLFEPYSSADLKDIIVARIARAGWTSSTEEASDTLHVFRSAAIELCCRKVHATSGDARRALELCRQVSQSRLCACNAIVGSLFHNLFVSFFMHSPEQAFDRARTSWRQKNEAASDDSDNETRRVVELQHMVAVIKDAFGSKYADSIAALPHQGKVLLCVAVSMTRRGGAAASRLTYGQLQDGFVDACGRSGGGRGVGVVRSGRLGASLRESRISRSGNAFAVRENVFLKLLSIRTPKMSFI